MKVWSTHKAPWAETSFTRHGVGLSQTETKPIQTLKPPSVTLKSEVKKREKDKACGPALYGSESLSCAGIQ